MSDQEHTILELLTPRLAIRIPNEEDYEASCEARCAPNPKPHPWDLPPRQSLTREEFDIERAHKLKRYVEDRDYLFSIFDRRDDSYIGSVSLMDVSRAIFQNAYLGYYIHHTRRRRAYAYEACVAILSFAFEHLELHRVEAGIEPENKPSIKLAKSLGLRFESLSPRRLFVRDAWRDMELWVMTAEEYTAST